MQRARSRDALPDAEQVYRELSRDPDLPPGVARDALPLAGLVEAAPRAGHAPAYAALAAESGIRRRLAESGSRLEQAAADGGLQTARHAVTLARRDLDACTAQWQALPAPLRREPPGPLSAERGSPIRRLRGELRKHTRNLTAGRKTTGGHLPSCGMPVG